MRPVAASSRICLFAAFFAALTLAFAGVAHSAGSTTAPASTSSKGKVSKGEVETSRKYYDEIDPETGKVLGYMGTYTGAVRVDSVDKVTRAAITDSARETTAGDLLFAVDNQTVSRDIVPRAPPAGVKGQIMAVVDGTSMIGQYHVVAVNRGTKDGLETGHVLAIDQKGEVIADQSCKRSMLSWCIGKKLDMPDERAGTLLVFKTYDNMSYGLIVMTTVPVRVADRVRTP